jgi:hypothetical protein
MPFAGGGKGSHIIGTGPSRGGMCAGNWLGFTIRERWGGFFGYMDVGGGFDLFKREAL